MTRLDTTTESTGAEYLVLGHLLIQGIQSFKAYGNNPGFDLVSINPESGRSVTIQVKSRFGNKANGFPIKRFDCDFVVFVRLNRGVRVDGKWDRLQTKPPDFYVFPVSVVSAASEERESFQKAQLRKMSDTETYRDAWHLIAKSLAPRVRKSA